MSDWNKQALANIAGIKASFDGDTLAVEYDNGQKQCQRWSYNKSRDVYKSGDVWRDDEDEVIRCIRDLAKVKPEDIAAAWVSQLSPGLMLRFGAFDGAYFHTDTGARKGLPLWWFNTPWYTEKPDKDNNYFKVSASQPWETWRDNGWLPRGYNLGWFHWFCFYYLGKTSSDEVDRKQIARARSFIARQGSKSIDQCGGDLTKKLRLRQSLLNWGSSRAFM